MAETKRKEREIFPLTLGWEWGCVRVAATLPSIVHVRVRPSFAKLPLWPQKSHSMELVASTKRADIVLQGSAKRWTPGCMNATGRVRHKW